MPAAARRPARVAAGLQPASTDICARDRPLEWDLQRFDNRASSMRVFALPGAGAPAPVPAPQPVPPAAAPPASPAADRATAWAESKVGTRECAPAQTGWVRAYNRSWTCDTYWCGIFVFNAYRSAGAPIRGGYASTEWIHDSATAGRNGLSAVPLDQVRRGDLVLMYTRKVARGRDVGHVGIARGPVSNGAIPTVEGNISNNVVLRERSITARYNSAHKLVVLVARVGV